MRNVIVILVLLFLVSCDKNNEDINDLPPEIETGLLEDRVISIAGVEREYHLFVPSNPLNAPVVILFHGNGGSNDDLIGLNNARAPYKVWLDIAENENIILAIPNGTIGLGNNRGWNDCRADAATNPNNDDVLFISSLIDFIIDTYNANSAKIYVLGTSNGGHFCIRLAEEIPSKLTAFGAIVSSNSVNSQCTNSNIPISALIMNGTSDPILPYHGGQVSSNRGEVFSTDETIQYWINRNGTDTAPEVFNFSDINSSDDSTVERRIFRNGLNNSEVVFYRVTNGGHTEPSIEHRYRDLFLLIVGNQNADIEMANEVWSFFNTKSR